MPDSKATGPCTGQQQAAGGGLLPVIEFETTTSLRSVGAGAAPPGRAPGMPPVPTHGLNTACYHRVEPWQRGGVVGWIRAAAAGFRRVVRPVRVGLASRLSSPSSSSPTAFQLCSVLAWLAVGLTLQHLRPETSQARAHISSWLINLTPPQPTVSWFLGVRNTQVKDQ